MTNEHIHIFVFLRQRTTYIGKVKNKIWGTTDYVHEVQDVFYCQRCLEYRYVHVDTYHTFSDEVYKD